MDNPNRKAAGITKGRRPVFQKEQSMTLQQIHYAITIAKEGSLNKAAEKLYIAQPSITSSLQELEKELGITVFYRSGRGVSLTPDGAEFILYAREVYSQYESLMDRYGEAHNLKRKFGVSAQHYSYAVKAFVEMVKNSTRRSMNSPWGRRRQRMSSQMSAA